MEALVNMNDKQGMEICQKVWQILVNELDSETLLRRIEQMLAKLHSAAIFSSL